MSAVRGVDFFHLSDESLVQILKFLNYKDLTSLSSVCQRFRHLTCDDCFWRWQCQYYYLINSCLEGLSWKQMFVRMHKEYGRYINHYREIRSAWNKIETFLKNHCLAMLGSLQDGATEESIDDAERRVGYKLPLDVRLSYRIHDGQTRNYEIGLLGGGMISTHVESEKLLPLDVAASISKHKPGWISLSFCPSTASGHIISLSDSGRLSSSGIVYRCGHLLLDYSVAPVECYHIADSFTEWFCNYAENLKKNAYYFLSPGHIFRFYHESSCVAETSGITIKPTTCFLPSLSGDDTGHFFFAYRIVMSMDKNAPSDLSCQLESRHWEIADGDNGIEEVDGPGVIGQYPIMRPGAEFAWISCCTFKSCHSSMRGFFRMRNLITGVITEVECPEYHMKVPSYIRVDLFDNKLHDNDLLEDGVSEENSASDSDSNSGEES